MSQADGEPQQPSLPPRESSRAHEFTQFLNEHNKSAETQSSKPNIKKTVARIFYETAQSLPSSRERGEEYQSLSRKAKKIDNDHFLRELKGEVVQAELAHRVQGDEVDREQIADQVLDQQYGEMSLIKRDPVHLVEYFGREDNDGPLLGEKGRLVEGILHTMKAVPADMSLDQLLLSQAHNINFLVHPGETLPLHNVILSTNMEGVTVVLQVRPDPQTKQLHLEGVNLGFNPDAQRNILLSPDEPTPFEQDTLQAEGEQFQRAFSGNVGKDLGDALSRAGERLSDSQAKSQKEQLVEGIEQIRTKGEYVKLGEMIKGMQAEGKLDNKDVTNQEIYDAVRRKDWYRDIDFLRSKDPVLMEAVLQEMGALPEGMTWEEFSKSAQWQDSLSRTARLLLPTKIAGIDVYLDPPQRGDENIHVALRPHLDATVNLALKGVEVSSIESEKEAQKMQQAEEQERQRQEKVAKEEKVRLLREKHEQIPPYIKRKGILGFIGMKKENPEWSKTYQELTDAQEAA